MNQRQSWRSRRACRRRQKDLKKAVMELPTFSCPSEEVRSFDFFIEAQRSSKRSFGLLHALVKDTKDLILPSWKPALLLSLAKESWEWNWKYPVNCKRQQIQEQPVFQPVYPETSNLTKIYVKDSPWKFQWNSQSAISKYSSAKLNLRCFQVPALNWEKGFRWN